MRGVAEDVVLGLVLELRRDDTAGCHIIHHGDLGFLEEALRCQCHTGVDVAHRRGDFFLVDQFLGNLYAAFVFGLVVTLDDLQLAAQQAAGLVDFFNGEPDAVTHADAHRRRAG